MCRRRGRSACPRAIWLKPLERRRKRIRRPESARSAARLCDRVEHGGVHAGRAYRSTSPCETPPPATRHQGSTAAARRPRWMAHRAGCSGPAGRWRDVMEMAAAGAGAATRGLSGAGTRMMRATVLVGTGAGRTTWIRALRRRELCESRVCCATALRQRSRGIGTVGGFRRRIRSLLRSRLSGHSSM